MRTAEPRLSMGAQRGHLPVEVDSFVGRRRELEEIRRLFADFPLVTLVGLGGVGKTRLVVRSAMQMSRAFADGVCFVDLGGIRDPALLLTTIADAIGLRDPGMLLTEEAVIDVLSPRHALLVLDNCEHLVDEVAHVADHLLHTCPELRVLATSRERLGIQGEGLLQVLPLAIPDGHGAALSQALPRFDAVSLFAERARAVVPEFTLTEQNGSDVATICREVDGLPLALELAAARLRTLSPRELATRLSQRLTLLTAGSRAGPGRHQTMRLCVDWSYEACSSTERLLWARLSVFAGSFELEAVEAVCAFGELDDAAALDVLSSLVEKSIVSRNSGGISTRYRLLEMLREYGQERLEEAGAVREVRDRHRDWYAALTERVRTDQVSPRQMEWAALLDRELPNLRLALEHSLIGPHQAPVAQRMAGCLHLFWISRGLLSEGRYWLGRAIAAETAPSHHRSQALFSAVALAGFQGDLGAAEAATRECLEIADLAPDDITHSYALSVDGMLALFGGDLPRAVTLLEGAAGAHHANGDTLREVEILIGLALASGLQGDFQRAEEVHRQILGITRPLGESWYQSYSLWALGLANWRRGEHEQAAGLLSESLKLRRVMNDLMGSAWCVEGLAMIAASARRSEHAAILMGAASSMKIGTGSPPATFPDLATAYDESQAVARTALGDRAFERAFGAGQAMDMNAAVAFALGEVTTRAQMPVDSWSVLTKRESQVAALVASGLSNRAIAEKLVISIRTAENHVEKILTKLGLTSRTQVAAWVADRESDAQPPAPIVAVTDSPR